MVAKFRDADLSGASVAVSITHPTAGVVGPVSVANYGQPAATVPAQASAPTIAVVEVTSLDLTLPSAPSDGGSPIIRWDASFSDDNFVTETVELNVSDQQRFDVGAGTWKARVRVVNSVGEGAWSANSNEVTIAVTTAPAQMSAPTLSATATVINVDLAADPADGGSPITRRDVRVRTTAGPGAWVVTQGVNDPHNITGRTPSTSYDVQARAVNGVDPDPDNWSASATISTAASSGGAQVSYLFIESQNSAGEVNIAYAVTSNTSVTGVATTSNTAPTAAQIAAGQDHTGAAAPITYSDSWTTAGAQTEPAIPNGLASATYYLHVLPSGGSDGDVVTSNGFTLETILPTFSTRETNAGGDILQLTANEVLAGESTPSDWTVTIDAVPVDVIAVSINDDLVSLNLGDLADFGETVLVSYSGTGITDMFANQMASFGPSSVTNNVAEVFAETAITVVSGTILSAPALLPAETKAFLFFASYERPNDGRTILMSIDGQLTSVHLDYDGTPDSFYGHRTRIYDTAGNNEQLLDESVPAGNRAHVLIDAHKTAGGVITVRSAVMDADAVTPAFAVLTGTQTSTVGSSIRQATETLRLFAQNMNGTNIVHPFSGTIYRMALWSKTSTGPVADISDSAVQALFGDGDGLVNPAVSRLAIGLPDFDFSGPASKWNAGVHDGIMSNFTRTGSSVF